MLSQTKALAAGHGRQASDIGMHVGSHPRITPAQACAHCPHFWPNHIRIWAWFWLSLLCVRRARCADEIKRRTLWTSRPFSGVCRPPLAVCVRCCSGLWSRVARAKFFSFCAGRVVFGIPTPFYVHVAHDARRRLPDFISCCDYVAMKR